MYGASFIPNIPFGSIRVMSRESKLKDSSKGGDYAHMQVLESARQQSMPDGDTRDLDLFTEISAHFHPTTVGVRRDVEKRKRLNGQLGNPSKFQEGKMAADVEETQKLVKQMVPALLAGVVKPFMDR